MRIDDQVFAIASRMAARLWLGWLLAFPMGAAAVYVPCQPVPPVADNRNPFIALYEPFDAVGERAVRLVDLCYGTYLSWVEKAFGKPGNVQLDRRFELYRPADFPPSQKLPLIIWAHGNGSTQAMDVKGRDGNYPALETRVRPALRNGFAFMSVEFRHPRVSIPYRPPPPPPPPEPDRPEFDVANTDIATAVQWVRWRADDLGVDADNIFLLGKSRGSLSILTALMPDQARVATAGEPYAASSSKPRAVFAIQAQTSYDHDQLRDLLVLKEATATALQRIVQLPLEFPSCLGDGSAYDYHCHFDRVDPVFLTEGSALSELDEDDPPVWLRYERAPTDPERGRIVPLGLTVARAGADQNAGLCFEPAPLRCLDVHHPNFGLALRMRFLELGVHTGSRAQVFVQYADATDPDWAEERFFDSYTCFFIQHLTPEGNLRRKAARTTPDCALHETDVWPAITGRRQRAP
ncbi:MAG: hypothetical protein IV094_18910 [Vitreoscilla sp.]|nr:hypothetical protein [Vitreoscilla sp.]